jgi:hypothetical protein
MGDRILLLIGADETGAVVVFLKQSDDTVIELSEQSGTWHHWVQLCDSLGQTPGALLKITVSI